MFHPMSRQKLLSSVVVFCKNLKALISLSVLLFLGCAGPVVSASHDSTASPILGDVYTNQSLKASGKSSCKTAQNLKVNFLKPVGERQLSDWAMNHSPMLKVARMQIKQTKAKRYRFQYWTPYNPNVQTDIGTRTEQGDVGLELGVSIQQQFEIGGQRALRRGVVQADVAVSKARLDELCWSLKVKLKEMVALAQLSQQRIATMNALKALYEKSYTLAQKRVLAGQDAKPVLLALRVDLAQLKQQLLNAQSIFKLQVSQIKQIVGLPPSHKLILEKNVQLSKWYTIPSQDALTKRALIYNKRLRTQSKRVAKANAESSLQIREGWVDPTVGLSYGREGGRDPAHLFMLSLSVDIPLFDKNQEKIASAHADVLLQRARMRQMSRYVQMQIAQTCTQFNAAKTQLDVYSKTIAPTLKQDMYNVQTAFVAGELGLSKLVQVQKRIFAIELSNLDAQRQMIIARTKIERLVGGRL